MKRILWINKTDHVARIPSWLCTRGRFRKVLSLHHADTGATSICFFNGDFEAGIIRCANDELTAAAERELLDCGVEVVADIGGDV